MVNPKTITIFVCSKCQKEYMTFTVAERCCTKKAEGKQ